MTTSDDIIHWAERALNEPYPEQDYSWIRLRHAGVLVAAGAASTALVAAAVFLVPHARPGAKGPIQIANFQMQPSYPIPGAGETLAPPHAAPAPTSRSQPLQKVEYAPNQRSIAASSETSRKVEAAPKKEVALARMDSGAQAAAARGLPSADSIDGSPHAGKAATAETAAPRTAEKKPVDIAPGEKLGIQAILVDGIVSLNGRKIRTGAPLPNGEILVGTDPSKGMVETDRRVLIVTP